jgi:hypothetical protein
MDQRTGTRCAPGDGPAPVHAEIVLPAAQRALAGHWALDQDVLWNAAELTELAVSRRTAREYDVALPHELDAEGRIALAQAFAVFLADRYGCAVDTTVHAPSAQGDPVFVDGCFWHGCPLHGTLPRQNAEWWANKLQANARRDRNTDAKLEGVGARGAGRGAGQDRGGAAGRRRRRSACRRG